MSTLSKCRTSLASLTVPLIVKIYTLERFRQLLGSVFSLFMSHGVLNSSFIVYLVFSCRPSVKKIQTLAISFLLDNTGRFLWLCFQCLFSVGKCLPCLLVLVISKKRKTQSIRGSDSGFTVYSVFPV